MPWARTLTAKDCAKPCLAGWETSAAAAAWGPVPLLGLTVFLIAAAHVGEVASALAQLASVVPAFVLFNLGVAARVFLAAQWPVAGLWLAAACWSLAFLVYALRYAPMLLSARVDGHPG